LLTTVPWIVLNVVVFTGLVELSEQLVRTEPTIPDDEATTIAPADLMKNSLRVIFILVLQ